MNMSLSRHNHSSIFLNICLISIGCQARFGRGISINMNYDNEITSLGQLHSQMGLKFGQGKSDSENDDAKKRLVGRLHFLQNIEMSERKYLEGSVEFPSIFICLTSNINLNQFISFQIYMMKEIFSKLLLNDLPSSCFDYYYIFQMRRIWKRIQLPA